MMPDTSTLLLKQDLAAFSTVTAGPRGAGSRGHRRRGRGWRGGRPRGGGRGVWRRLRAVGRSSAISFPFSGISIAEGGSGESAHRLLIRRLVAKSLPSLTPLRRHAEHTVERRWDCFPQSPSYGDWRIALPGDEIDFAAVNERCGLRTGLLRRPHEEMNSLVPELGDCGEAARASNLVWSGFGSARRTRGRIQSGRRIDDRRSCLPWRG